MQFIFFFLLFVSKATLFVGNLSYSVDEIILKEEVERISGPGTVAKARIAIEKDTNRKRGFGYVDIWKKEVAQQVLCNVYYILKFQRIIRSSFPRYADYRENAWIFFDGAKSER